MTSMATSIYLTASRFCGVQVQQTEKAGAEVHARALHRQLTLASTVMHAQLQRWALEESHRLDSVLDSEVRRMTDRAETLGSLYSPEPYAAGKKACQLASITTI